MEHPPTLIGSGEGSEQRPIASNRPHAEPHCHIRPDSNSDLIAYFTDHLLRQYPLVECEGTHFFSSQFLVIASLPGSEGLLYAILAFAAYQLSAAQSQCPTYKTSRHYQMSIVSLQKSFAAGKMDIVVALASLQHAFTAVSIRLLLDGRSNKAVLTKV